MKPLKLVFGDVQAKRIETPNDFISHMVEHIAWRLGCSIDLQWPNEDWRSLGSLLGTRIRSFRPRHQSAAALGMIDDGSAEVLIDLEKDGDLNISAGANIDLEWFLSLRCEQLSALQDIIELLTGLAKGLGAQILVKVCNFEDTSHTWEGVFRAVGMVLNKLFAPAVNPGLFSSSMETVIDRGDIIVISRSGYRVTHLGAMIARPANDNALL